MENKFKYELSPAQREDVVEFDQNLQLKDLISVYMASWDINWAMDLI
jgi:hypothetical protein